MALFEKFLDENPLAIFSTYTHTQSQWVINLGKEIIAELAVALEEPKTVKTEHMTLAYAHFWFWILGVYEVIRTMDQHSKCFAASLALEIKKHKKFIGKLRMVFAKQEYQYQKGKIINNEMSIAGFGKEFNTLIFNVEGEEFDAVKLIRQFEHFFLDIRREQIISDCRDEESNTST
ncbi:MAG TPA: hypothetical protein DCY07_01640 [Rhodospirillaceae bacterium]|nr:hypothetical protein [Rhodospirillaceae bacterium]